tara:strand:+ start:12439 stop:12675 length:237 start_codon:yes stop_codon:yes gene_type:complete
MTTTDKKILFQEVLEGNAKMFFNGCNNKAEYFCYDKNTANYFENFTSDQIRQLAVNYFKVLLTEKANEMNKQYLTNNI